MEQYPCRHRKEHFIPWLWTILKHPPGSWIKNIWNFAHEYVISLSTSYNRLILHREGDIFITKKFSQSGFMPRQLRKLNWCWLYLQIHTLSNIYKLHGTYFHKKYYDIQQDEFIQDTHSWTAQGYPGPKYFNFSVRPSGNDSQVIIDKLIFKN